MGADTLAGNPLAVGAPKYNAAITSFPIKSSPAAAPQTVAQLEASGVLIPISSTPAFAAVGSVSILNTTLFGNPLVLNTKRNEFFANAEKELIGRNLVVFGDFILSQTTNGGSGLAPAPIIGLGAGGGNALSIPANNPYNLFGITLGVGQPAGAPTVITRMTEIGKRGSINETNTWRFVSGFKGEINDQYSWEADYNYARASLVQQVLGGANGANMNTAMQPLLDAQGNYVFNAAGRPLSLLTDATGKNLPVFNYFATAGFNDPATLNALRVTLFKNQATSLRDVSFRLRGKPYELPAGSVAFAVGIEARHEDLTSNVDGLYAMFALAPAPALGPTAVRSRFVANARALVANTFSFPTTGLFSLSFVVISCVVAGSLWARPLSLVRTGASRAA